VFRIVWLALLMLIISCTMLAEQDEHDRLSGIVVSENGAPISGVKIFGWRDGTTDAEGRFAIASLPSKDSVVYFQKEGFRPKAFVFKTGTSTVKVILENDSKTAWFLPACASKDSTTSPRGYELTFSLSKRLQFKEINDIDYQEYLVSAPNETKPLQLWWGILVSPGETVRELIVSSTNFEERSIRRKSGETVGYDRRGRTQDGMAWRSADFPGLSATAIYHGVSKEVARAYDEVIDSACQLEQTR
jgi:hypothetical protein